MNKRDIEMADLVVAADKLIAVGKQLIEQAELIYESVVLLKLSESMKVEVPVVPAIKEEEG
jgi:hypothetical protein